MPILATLHRADGIDVHGKTVSRTAVRGVILAWLMFKGKTGYFLPGEKH